MGRFTSPDPGNAGADLTNPQSGNGYGYVWNDPLNATDPTGLCTTSDDPPCYSGGTTLPNDSAPVGTWAWWWNFGWQTLTGTVPSYSNGGGGGSPANFTATGTGVADRNPQPVSTPLKNAARPDWLNNITSIFGYDQRIKLPSCAAMAFKTAADDLNPFLPAAAEVAQGALSVGQAAKFNQALTYAAAKGLTYPNKSSVFRGILNTSKTLGKISDTLPLVNLDYALTDGLITEIKAMNQGQCQ